MSAAMGGVEGGWSCRYAQFFRALQNVVQAPLYFSVATTWAQWLAHSANDSFSQRSSHQVIVTRSPNHMCASSCSTVFARLSSSEWVVRLRKTYSSRRVTQPAFSIAPMLYSGTNAWSYLWNGYGVPNAR